MAAKAAADSLDIPLGGIFRGVRLPETSTEHDLYETAALWWNRPRDIRRWGTPRRTTRRSSARPPTTRVNAGNEDS